MIYHGVWLYSLLGYADVTGKMNELFRTPEMYYYAQYFLNLMCPDGMIPDFGDADWQSNWSRFLVFFEAAASFYNDAEMKWAANVIADRFIDWNFIFNNIMTIKTNKMIRKQVAQLIFEVFPSIIDYILG